MRGASGKGGGEGGAGGRQEVVGRKRKHETK